MKDPLKLREMLQTDEEFRKFCRPQREDYFECLHGRKERARIQAVLAEKKRQEQGGEVAHH